MMIAVSIALQLVGLVVLATFLVKEHSAVKKRPALRQKT
jgi:hypothetical protein